MDRPPATDAGYMPSADFAFALSLVTMTPRFLVARYTTLMFTPASATERAIWPMVPGRSIWSAGNSAIIGSASPSTLIPAPWSAVRVAAASTTSRWMIARPSADMAAIPSMLIPATPSASPIRASSPGRSSRETVRSFIRHLLRVRPPNGLRSPRPTVKPEVMRAGRRALVRASRDRRGHRLDPRAVRRPLPAGQRVPGPRARPRPARGLGAGARAAPDAARRPVGASGHRPGHAPALRPHGRAPRVRRHRGAPPGRRGGRERGGLRVAAHRGLHAGGALGLRGAPVAAHGDAERGLRHRGLPRRARHADPRPR